MTSSARAYWDGQAATFDDEPDHGVGPEETRVAWQDHLRRWLPDQPCHVLDLGCGTGSLSVLVAQDGHRVTGIDFAPAMIERAQDKASDHEVDVRFMVGDASDPQVPPASVDVVLCRHVLWALPDQSAAIARWVGFLKPGGRFVLVEGSWSTGAGLTADQTVELLRPYTSERRVETLTDIALWGRQIDDERYCVLAQV